MARSINIGPLALHSFFVTEDSIKVHYNKTKKDQSGDKVRNKHLYANPHLPIANVNLALGIWFYHECSRFERTSFLFGENDTAVSLFCYVLCLDVASLIFFKFITGGGGIQQILLSV